jgi:hypothetical protein
MDLDKLQIIVSRFKISPTVGEFLNTPLVEVLLKELIGGIRPHWEEQFIVDRPDRLIFI